MTLEIPMLMNFMRRLYHQGMLVLHLKIQKERSLHLIWKVLKDNVAPSVHKTPQMKRKTENLLKSQFQKTTCFKWENIELSKRPKDYHFRLLRGIHSSIKENQLIICK